MNALWVRDDRNYDYPICLVHLLDFTIKLTWTFATLKNNDHMVMCGRSFLNSVKKIKFCGHFYFEIHVINDLVGVRVASQQFLQ